MNTATFEDATDEEIRIDDGVSLDSARARMLFLVSQNKAILTQTQFADAKAGALMTVLLLISIKGSAPGIATIQDPVELLSMICVIVSIGFCLVAIMPRVRGLNETSAPSRNNRYTWLSMTTPAYSEEEHGEYARLTDLGSMLNSVASSNIGAARVLARKFNMLRLAFFSGFTGCALLLLATNT